MSNRIFSLLLLMLTCISSFAQQKVSVTGTVIDYEGEPIIGASVVVKGTTNGTSTDVDGKYSLNVAKDDVLVFSFVGLKSQEIAVNGRKVINVSMLSSSVNLDDVVVVAYGTQSKRTLTTSVSSVKAEALKDAPVNSIDQALQGRATGVSMTTPSAGVGEAPVIRIRGVASITSGTQPLYVIDGVPVETANGSYSGNSNPLADLNPSDILSMDVLKDAAAASLYGSRAANGVILITTKQGSKGKVKVSYNGYFGLSQRSKFFDVMNAQQYTDFKNQAVKNRYGTDNYNLTTNKVTTDGTKAYNLMQRSNGEIVDTNWENEIFQNGIQHSHSVSLDGGTDKGQFYISANYANQKGIVQGDRYNRFGLNASGSVQATKYLKIGASVNTSVSTTEYVDRSRRGGQYATEGFPRLGLILPTNIPAWREDGTPYEEDHWMGKGNNTTFNGYTNPAGLLYYKSRVNSEIIRMLGNVYAEIKPFAGMTLKTQFGLDYNHIDDTDFRNSIIFGDYENGSVGNHSTKRTRKTWTNTATYVFSIGDKNNFDILLGEETSEKYLNRWGARRNTLLDDKFTTYQGSWGSTDAEGNSISENSLLSFFGRLNYDYDAKYLVSLNMRRDGFSALSKDNRWGTFGGVSAAWRISAEKFWDPIRHYVNDLKIKSSWGIVGNTDVGDYAAWSYYNSTYYGPNGAYVLGQIADSQNLKWETSEKFDIGFNAVLFNNIELEVDYFRNKSTDLILAVPVAHSLGIPGHAITTNAGSMQNTGWEFNISANVIDNKTFKWKTSFNITTTKNEVLSLADGVTELTSGSYNKTLPGYSIGQLFLYPTNGIDRETGRRIFIDKNGKEALCMYEKGANKFYYRDGSVCPESNLTPTLCGNTQATFYGGWTNNFDYKGIDLTLMFQFSGGNYLYNGTKATCSDMRYWNNTIDVLNNHWSESNKDNATYAYPIYGDNYSNGSSKPISDFVEKADYIRLKQVSLGYTFNTKKFNIGISSIRVYAQAQNLFTITGYSGLDPEANLYGNSSTASYANLQAGVDKNTMPQARTYTFGANISF